MAKTKEQKAEALQELQKMMANEGVIFVRTSGLTVAQAQILRGALRAEGGNARVEKKTLMRIAAEKSGLPEPTEEMMDGMIAVIYSDDNILGVASAAQKFAKENEENFQLVGGYFEKEVLSAAKAVALASIPPREVLLSQFLNVAQGPVRGFAVGCGQMLSGFARAVQAYADKRKAEGES